MKHLVRKDLSGNEQTKTKIVSDTHTQTQIHKTHTKKKKKIKNYKT